MKEIKNAGYLSPALAVTAALLLGIAGETVAEQVKLNVGLGKPVLLAGQKQTTYLKVGLTGFQMRDRGKRAPVNVAIVLDKSGSMTGEKIRKAREAALMVLDRLDSNDIVSVVTYNNTVHVVVPATKLSDIRGIKAAIRGIEAGGSTALFAGVSKGAAEVRKFINRKRVNRVILLSDGLANVGPSSPSALGDLGSSLIKEGISVTTVGLGLDYNEDLLAKLANNSDGNHAFAESAADLARIFRNEFGDVLSVAAQEVVVKIQCARGIRPVRVLGREADIVGRTVTAHINQIYGNQEKYVLLEVEIPATEAGRTRSVATVNVTYANMQTGTTDRLSSTVAARFTGSGQIVERETNAKVMVEAVKQIVSARNNMAVALRDKGDIRKARVLIQRNVAELKEYASKFNSEDLEKEATWNNDFDQRLETDDDWRGTRKRMRDYQNRLEYQRGW